ncbi:MAG TPA: NUDIX hydrolase [Pyrinomonadaceae bacterium]|nr:NUDIX hydrolase [Pyrinomonadaceae bacterium]
MNQPETLKTEEIYRGRIFEVSLATVREDGKTYTREIISHPGSAVIVPVFADETVALVRQYRHPAGKYLLEIPAGSLTTGEDPKAGAERELEEEIGVRAARVEKLTEFYVSPGFLGEKMHVYLATDFTESRQNLEDDELLRVERISLRECGELIKNGAIEDAKTMIGLTFAAARFGIQFF